MEQQGWLKATWGVTEKKRQARFYELTRAGRTQLERERAAWEQLTAGVQKVLSFA